MTKVELEKIASRISVRGLTPVGVFLSWTEQNILVIRIDMRTVDRDSYISGSRITIHLTEKHEYSVWGLWTEIEARNQMIRAIMKVWEHELWENLYYDGKRFSDPHLAIDEEIYK